MMKLAARMLAVSVPAVLMCVFLARPGLPQAEPRLAESRVPVATADVADGVRVAVFWDAKAAVPKCKVGMRLVKSDEEFVRLLTLAQEDFQKVKQDDAVVSIDAAGEVPWSGLIQVVSMCKKAGWKRIEFVTP